MEQDSPGFRVQLSFELCDLGQGAYLLLVCEMEKNIPALSICGEESMNSCMQNTYLAHGKRSINIGSPPPKVLISSDLMIS